ncbi:hypothetical protein Gotri_017244, partial [Gossypium trilobum]|nr:hypothetical protein [Gossypium trilobum]
AHLVTALALDKAIVDLLAELPTKLFIDKESSKQTSVETHKYRKIDYSNLEMARLLVVCLFLISLCFSSWVQSASAQPLQVGSPSPPPSTGGSTGGGS